MTTAMKTVEHEGRRRKKATRETLRVAAYCRVSTEQEYQELSYESQCDYFKQLIEGNEGMVLVGVYGDHGLSGLHAENREALQRLLDDCRDGMIDLVMTKSISRLSRNAKDFKMIMTTFKECGVRAYFEKEEFYSDDPQCEMLMEFMVAVASEEIRSLSENIKLAHEHNNALGRPITACAYGYRKKKRKAGEPHVWEVFEPEARLVRKAYELKKEGYNNSYISRVLLKLQEQEPEAKQKKWGSVSVSAMLKHEAYKGDLVTSKTYRPDYMDGKTKRNKGERTQYYLEDHHPAIVSRELWGDVQEILRNRRRAYE